MTAWASGPSYGLMMAVFGEVGEEKTAGGKARVCRYARLAVVKTLVRSWETMSVAWVVIGQVRRLRVSELEN